MARTTKKRQRELKHDKFRDTTLGVADRLAHRYEGRGRTILYVIAGAIALVALVLVFNWWRAKQADAARLALGKAIEIAEARISTAAPMPGETGPTFPNERERAQKAVEEFQKVQKEYGSPYGELARYFAAVQLLTLERERGLKELEELSKSGDAEVAARAKFALGQAREADAQYDVATALYQELLNVSNGPVSANTLNLRIASVYEKQGKKDEAVNLLFKIVEGARNAKGKDGKPAPESGVIRAAADKLQELSPDRYAQLPAAPVASNRMGF